jgi:hypothetical protein
MTVLHRLCSSRSMLDRMMECSQLQLSEIAEHGDSHQKLVANRVLETPRSRKHWENAHCLQLRSIANAWTAEEQVRAARRMGLAMIHRKAPFEYLRDRRVSGMARQRFFEVVYGRPDFSSSFVNEHRNYLDAGASYICLDRLCGESSTRLLADYEQRYAVYLRAQFRQLDNEHCGRQEQSATWLGYLRNDLRRQRQSLLAAPPSKADTLTLEELYRPTGDTVRMTWFA